MEEASYSSAVAYAPLPLWKDYNTYLKVLLVTKQRSASTLFPCFNSLLLKMYKHYIAGLLSLYIETNLMKQIAERISILLFTFPYANMSHRLNRSYSLLLLKNTWVSLPLKSFPYALSNQSFNILPTLVPGKTDFHNMRLINQQNSRTDSPDCNIWFSKAQYLFLHDIAWLCRRELPTKDRFFPSCIYPIAYCYNR